jgi:hypothetical protein
MPLASERLIPEEEIDRSLALIFIVLPNGDAGLLRGPGTGRQWLANIRQELCRALIEANLRSLGIIGTGVDIQNVLHVPAELSVFVRGDAPLLPELRRQTVFLRTRRTSS